MILAYGALIALILIVLFLLWERSVKKPVVVPDRSPFYEETAQEAVSRFRRPLTVPPPIPELPRGYGESRVTLMARDPEWLFAYWEVASDHLNALAQTLGQQAASHENITLRVFELADDMGYFDIEVKNPIGDWHIRVGKPDSPFYCLLGLKYEDSFIPLAVSNTVTTPRNTLSNLFDDEWMLVNDYEQRLLKRIGATPYDATSPFMFRR